MTVPGLCLMLAQLATGVQREVVGRMDAHLLLTARWTSFFPSNVRHKVLTFILFCLESVRNFPGYGVEVLIWKN